MWSCKNLTEAGLTTKALCHIVARNWNHNWLISAAALCFNWTGALLVFVFSLNLNLNLEKQSCPVFRLKWLDADSASAACNIHSSFSLMKVQIYLKILVYEDSCLLYFNVSEDHFIQSSWHLLTCWSFHLVRR